MSGNSGRSCASTSPMLISAARTAAATAGAACEAAGAVIAVTVTSSEPRAGDEHQPELADLHLVAVAQGGRLDPLAVDVRAVEAADVAHGERRRRPGGTRRAGGTRSRRRGRCRCPGAGRWWSRRGRAGTGRRRSGPRRTTSSAMPGGSVPATRPGSDLGVGRLRRRRATPMCSVDVTSSGGNSSSGRVIEPPHGSTSRRRAWRIGRRCDHARRPAHPVDLASLATREDLRVNRTRGARRRQYWSTGRASTAVGAVTPRQLLGQRAVGRRVEQVVDAPAGSAGLDLDQPAVAVRVGVDQLGLVARAARCGRPRCR